MKLFFLCRYDDYIGQSLVIRAENEDIARELATLTCDNKSVWLDKNLSTCEELFPEGEREIICSEWNLF